MVNKRKIKLGKGTGNRKSDIIILDMGAREDVLRWRCLNENLKVGMEEFRDIWQNLANSRDFKESRMGGAE